MSNNSSIHHKFLGQGTDGDCQVEYSIEVMPDSRHEEAVKFMVDHFMGDAVMASSRNLKNDPVGAADMSMIWREMLKENLSLFCHESAKSKIVAINILGICNENDQTTFKSKSKDLDDIMTVMDVAAEKFDVFGHYGVAEYLTGFGMSVDPIYRRKGIATELLKARVMLMRSMGFKLTSTVFTGIGSQKAAKEVGFEENFSITYAELRQLNDRLHFPGIDNLFCKIMSLKLSS